MDSIEKIVDIVNSFEESEKIEINNYGIINEKINKK